MGAAPRFIDGTPLSFVLFNDIAAIVYPHVVLIYLRWRRLFAILSCNEHTGTIILNESIKKFTTVVYHDT